MKIDPFRRETSPHPTLYQVNARALLQALRARLGQPLTLGEVPDGELDRLSAWGIDWVYLLGVWQTGQFGVQIARGIPALVEEFRQVLPDLREEDICGSCFAITGYRVNRELGSEDGLQRLRQRLNERGISLMLDFIPNHTARDHPWVDRHPEYYLPGEGSDVERSPENYGRAPGSGRVFAFGRDPNFPGWSDTFQLNYANPELQAAMRGELLHIADLCDGVRCDMAMLVLPEVFERTWGRRPELFWPEAIDAVRQKHPEFLFLAEVYWDLEPVLLQQGFDYAYDKRLYDRLRALQAGQVLDHLRADRDYQSRLARFLENHDEARAAAVFPAGVHECAALITYLSPGLRFFQEGQFEGYRLRLPVQLCRRPVERPDERLGGFYRRLLGLLKDPLLKAGTWQLLDCYPPNPGEASREGLIAFAWTRSAKDFLLVIVNYSSQPGCCEVKVPGQEAQSGQAHLTAVLSAESQGRPCFDLTGEALRVDLPAWGYLVLQGEMEV